MFTLVEKRKWYFLLSAIIIIPGLVAMIYSTITTGLPFKLAIDFTGGTIWELRFPQSVQPAELRQVFADAGFSDTAVTTVGDGKTLQVRLKPIDETVKVELTDAIKTKFGADVVELQYSSVGPAIGREVTQAAFLAVIAAALAIMGFLIVAFRKVPHPFRYGVSAIIAMIHDILVTVGIFSICSLLFGWQADALFLTAVLTVIGFSVQDTIVVFDRIRENYPEVPRRNLHPDRRSQPGRDAASLAGHTVERLVRDGSAAHLRRLHDAAVHRRDVLRPHQRYLLLDLQRSADSGRLGRQGLAGAEGRQDAACVMSNE